MGCSSAAEVENGPTGEPKTGGVAQVAFSEANANDVMDPALSSNQYTSLLGGLIFDPIFNRGENFEATPGLVEEWDVSDDAMTWTLKIREGVTFHDGAQLTAKDVAYTISRQLDPDLNARLYSRLSSSLSPEGVTTPSDYVVELKLDKPDGLLDVALASYQMYVVQNGATEFELPVGTGPFVIDSWTAGGPFEVTRNDNYWQEGLPYLDGVRGVVLPDQASKLRSVSSGDSDIMDALDYTLAATAEQDAAVKLETLPAASIITIAMDETQEPFDDVRVRQAFKLAMDREKILQVAAAGYGSVTGDVPIPTTDPNFPAETFIEQDVEEAKRLLAEAGYPDGIDVELTVAPLRSGLVDTAVLYADSVAEAGIRVSINQVPAANFFSTVWLQSPFYVSYWSTRQAVEQSKLTLVSDASGNESRFKSDEFDSLIDQAIESPSVEQQQEFTREAMELAATESGWMIPVVVDYISVMKTSLQGVRLTTLQQIDLTEAWFDNN